MAGSKQRSVPRPKNTIVQDNGGNGPHRYAVRARAGVRPATTKNGNPRPVNGKVIGHIVGGRFVRKK